MAPTKLAESGLYSRLVEDLREGVLTSSELADITGVKFGGRVSDHHRTNDNARNNDLNTIPGNAATVTALITQANQQCRVPFTTTSYMKGMGTNVTKWATFDNDCLFRTFAGSDDALRLIPPKQMSLEQCLEFLADDELLEVTPKNLRLRKSILDHGQRMKTVMRNR